MGRCRDDERLEGQVDGRMDGCMTHSVTNTYPGLDPGELLMNKAEGVEILSILFLHPTLGKQLL